MPIVYGTSVHAQHAPAIPTLGETVTSSRSTNADPHVTLTQSLQLRYFLMLLIFVLTEATPLLMLETLTKEQDGGGGVVPLSIA